MTSLNSTMSEANPQWVENIIPENIGRYVSRTKLLTMLMELFPQVKREDFLLDEDKVFLIRGKQITFTI